MKPFGPAPGGRRPGRPVAEGGGIPRRRAVLGACAALLAAAGLPVVAAGGRMFKDETYTELRGYEPSDRLLAVVRCESVESRSPGSRSERQVIRTTVLAALPAWPAGQPLMLQRYAQGAPLMAVGKAYLVAAYVESRAEPWALVEAQPTDAARAGATVQAAQADVAARLRP